MNNEKTESHFLDIPEYTSPLYDFLHGKDGTARHGNNIITIDTKTPVDLYAKVDGEKNPHRGRVFKHTIGVRVLAATNSNINAYKAGQQRSMEKAGHSNVEFKAKRASYYVQVNRHSCIELLKSNNEKEYFRYILNKIQSGKETFYTLDGEVIAWEDINGTKPPKAPYIIPETKDTDNPVISIPTRNIHSENITAMRAGGDEYLAQ